MTTKHECVAENMNGTPCGGHDTEKVSLFWLCPTHKAGLHNWMQAIHRDRIVGLLDAKDCLKRHTFGITYFIRLPNSNVTIGHVFNADQLVERMVELFHRFGGKVTLLATVYGGESMEALMHYRFASARNNLFMNAQFDPTDELLAFCKQTGNVPAGFEALGKLKQRLGNRRAGAASQRATPVTA